MSDLSLNAHIAPAGSGPAFLVVESGGLAGQQFPLPEPPGALLLGREPLCNIRFDRERDRVVGRTHARVEVRPDGVFLIDLNSANGTFGADGAAVRGERRWRPGDRFQLGGEGGPWLRLQEAAPSVAVHVARPLADIPTLITRPGEQPDFPAPREPELSRGARPSAMRTRPDSLSGDPDALQHRRQHQKQVAVIALLLVLSCAVGLALALHDSTGDGETETSRGK